nr:formin-like protein 5 [Aegilops tauschii subsp. strangulata]
MPPSPPAAPKPLPRLIFPPEQPLSSSFRWRSPWPPRFLLGSGEPSPSPLLPSCPTRSSHHRGSPPPSCPSPESPVAAFLELGRRLHLSAASLSGLPELPHALPSPPPSSSHSGAPPQPTQPRRICRFSEDHLHHHRLCGLLSPRPPLLPAPPRWPPPLLPAPPRWPPPLWMDAPGAAAPAGGLGRAGDGRSRPGRSPVVASVSPCFLLCPGRGRARKRTSVARPPPVGPPCLLGPPVVPGLLACLVWFLCSRARINIPARVPADWSPS